MIDHICDDDLFSCAGADGNVGWGQLLSAQPLLFYINLTFTFQHQILLFIIKREEPNDKKTRNVDVTKLEYRKSISYSVSSLLAFSLPLQTFSIFLNIQHTHNKSFLEWPRPRLLLLIIFYEEIFPAWGIYPVGSSNKAREWSRLILRRLQREPFHHHHLVNSFQ